MNRIIDFSRFHLEKIKPRECFIKDAVHREINFSQDRFWLYELVNTKEMQRLSQVKQCALTAFNFPSATHTRLIHSLGVYELSNRFIDHSLLTGDLVLSEDWKEINVALAYSLLHDIGHGPLSHAFEDAMDGFNHEKMGLKIIKSPLTKVNFLLKKKAIDDGLDELYYINELEKVFNKTTEHTWILDLVSSDVDVDRLDFLLRDSYYTGVSYGNTIDISLLIRWSVIKKDRNGDRRFSFSLKAKNQIEQFLSARKKMYVDLYCNSVSEFYESLFAILFRYFRNNSQEFVNEKSFGELSFLLEPFEDWSVEDFIWLNDDRLLNSIEDMFRNVKGEIRDYYLLLYGHKTEFDAKSFLVEKIKFRKEYIDNKKIKIGLWDDEANGFVTVSI